MNKVQVKRQKVKKERGVFLSTSIVIAIFILIIAWIYKIGFEATQSKKSFLNNINAEWQKQKSNECKV